MIGCGSYLVRVQERGGANPRVVPVVSGRWERVVDSTSSAEVIASAACCDLLADVDPFSHELVILRSVSGTSHRVVWLGPIEEVAFDEDPETAQIRITANDLTQWWRLRFVHADYDRTIETGSGPSRLIDQVVDLNSDALAPDASPGLVVLDTTPGSTLAGERKILAAENRETNGPISELARDSIDFAAHSTAANPRAVLVGEPQINHNAGLVTTLHSSHFARAPRVRRMRPVTRVVVSGAGGGAAGDEVVGIATASATMLARFGLIEARYDEPRIEDATSAQQAAEYRLSLLGPTAAGRAPTRVEDGILAPSAPGDLDDYYAGARFDIALSGDCISFGGRSVLTRLQCAFDGASEALTAAFTPAAFVEAS